MAAFVGSFTNFDDDFDLFHNTEDLTDLVVTADRISMDWEHDGEQLGVVMAMTEHDGFEIWNGNITSSMSRELRGEVTGVRYDLAGGGVVLIVKWSEDGYEGTGMYEILPK